MQSFLFVLVKLRLKRSLRNIASIILEFSLGEELPNEQVEFLYDVLFLMNIINFILFF